MYVGANSLRFMLHCSLFLLVLGYVWYNFSNRVNETKYFLDVSFWLC